MQARPRLVKLATRNPVAATQASAMNQTGSVTGRGTATSNKDPVRMLWYAAVAVSAAHEPTMIPQQIEPRTKAEDPRCTRAL